jgi:hypothetical protein
MIIGTFLSKWYISLLVCAEFASGSGLGNVAFCIVKFHPSSSSAESPSDHNISSEIAYVQRLSGTSTQLHSITHIFLQLTAKMSTESSTLYINATIITINPSREVIIDGGILVTGSRIVGVGKTSSFPASSLPQNTKIVSLKGRILLPGLINTHSHLAQSLLRGLAEDLPLHSWLCDAVWPLEASYGEDDGYVAARLTIAEMLKSGTTCFLESMLTHRSGFENVVRAVGESGIRACLVRPFNFTFCQNLTKL